MENLATVIIEGKRLILKPIALKYLEVVFQEFTSEIARFVYSKPANHINETQDFINQAINKIENKTDLTLTILNKSSWEFLGLCGIHQINTANPELGIWLKKKLRDRALAEKQFIY